MLSLLSDRWSQLRASPGGNGELTRRLLAEAVAGDSSGVAELWQQVCHQFTTGEVAYAAVPHLVDLAAVRGEPSFLVMVGAVVAGCGADPSGTPAIPADLRADYESALVRARELVCEMLARRQWERAESQELLATLAALTGHTNLAMHLLLAQGAEPDCPSCGEPIEFTRS